MLLIILGIALIVLGFVYEKTAGFYNYIENNIAMKAAFVIVLGIISVLLGVFAPLHGYKEPVIIQKCELEEIIENSNIYVIEKQNGNGKYEHVILSEYLEKSEVHNSSNTEIIVSNEYDKPTLVKYRIEAKKSAVTFAFNADRIEYVIYVSEENIKRLK